MVLITAAVAAEPIRDAVTGAGVGEATLGASTGYLAITPLSTVLDTLTLLTVGQHIALLVTAILTFIVWRVLRPRGASWRLMRELVAAVVFLVALVGTYACVAFLPRPMAALVVSDETVIAADFHSHTQYSHDGRRGWTEDDVRDWHRGAGYDVAYITDHATFEGAERGLAANPSVAGEGTMLLQGLEAFYKGEHVNVLSAGRHFRGLTDPSLKNVDEESLTLASLIPRGAPVLIETIPGNLNKVPAATQTSPGAQAIELIDGSPRGLSQGRRDRARIIHIADSLNLALVTGSDNHGYGRTAPGWTLLRIPGWRGMRSDSLSSMIELILRDGRRTSTRVVERVTPAANNSLELVLTAPVALWTMFATLTADERVMWIIWTWALVFVIRAIRSYRQRKSTATA